MTRRRLLAGLLTLIMVLQALVPGAALAKSSKPLNDNLITIGKLTKKDYPQIDKDTALRVAREQKNKRKGFLGRGATLFSADSPYITGQQPGDADKPKYLANITGKVEAKGLDGGNFDWNKIFGDKPIKLELRQLDKTKLDKQTNPLGETGLILTLEVSKAGEFKLTDRAGNLTDLPLFSAEGNPFEYQIQVDRKSYENVELIISTNAGTPGSKFEQVGEKQIATLSFTIGIQQLASTKFTSEWHTGVAEADRPQIEGYFKVGEDLDNDFNFPKNDTTRTILRSGFLENFVEDEENGPWAFIDSELEAAPESVEVKTDTAGLTFKDNNGVKTVTSGDHKFKYDFTYDVIDGGKLTMTEILPVTFDANDGKFASITDPNAEQKIVKEVEYDGTLTDKAENPTKDYETFKGWSTTADGKTPATEADFKNITKAKTFYAIWESKAFTSEDLTVHESYKEGDTYVNDFIPTLKELKEKVKVEGNGLTNEDKLAIVDDGGQVLTDAKAIKNYLYEKLKEDPATEISRDVTIKGRVTDAAGKTHDVTIPIKVIKNIYEAKTKEGKPVYVPDDYVKVTVDPTTKAKDPQKYTYYVNPKASVVIPGENPEGTGNNQFTKWLIKGTKTEYKLADHPRHKFTEAETTIEAQYVSDVIPANDDGSKPDTVPKNFVEVKFVPTDKATDETKAEKIFWVNPDKAVTIPVKDPVGKQYFTFKEWKIGDVETGETYKVGTPKQFKSATTITATYTEEESIIPYDPKEPTTKPDGYVRVTFAADPGLKLTEQKAYYVKKNANITLKAIKDDTTNYGYPGVTANTGYKFDKWDKEDSLVIEAADIVVTAKATKLDNAIPETNDQGQPNEKPKGYKTVTFEIKSGDEAKGSLEGVTKYYVNPNEYVKITPPATEAKTGYVFGSWDKDTTIPTVYDKDTTITGSFNELGAVIPKTKPDGTENKQPAGYNTVTFKLQTYHGKEAGQFVDGETTVYFVNPAKKVTIDPPKTSPNVGYKFNSWNPDPATARNYTMNNTEIWGRFEKIGDVIPSTDATGKSNPKPEGYVTVIFTKGKHGKKIEGKTIYYVNPDGNTQLKHMTSIADNRVNRPVVTPDVGYKFSGWSKDADHVIKSDLVVSANYTALPDVIPKDKPTGGENDRPEGYITVTFKTTDKAGSVEKVVYVNPEKAVALDSYAPKVNPITGYEFADWDRPIKEKIQYDNGDVITAQFNAKGDVIPQENPDGTDKPAGYLTVTFDKGEHGTLSGKTVYYVKPNKEVTVPAPDVKPSVGYEFEKWDKELTQTFAEDTKITAQYKERDNIIPQGKPDGSDRPDGYFTVTFKADANGSLSGKTVYYVKPNVDIDLTNTAKNITKNPNVGYSAEGGTWNPVIASKKYTENAEYTFKFKALDDVIPKTKDDESEKPDGYITVTFSTETNGKIEGSTKTTKVVYVNPNKAVVLKDHAPKVMANTGFEFAGWDTQIERAIQYKNKDLIKANYKPIGDVIPQENPDGSDRPTGYFTVTFEKGEHGKALSGKTVYYVKPNTEVTVPAPTVTPQSGWMQKAGTDAWDTLLTRSFADDTTITAQYDPLADIIPQEKTDGSDKPEGYVTVTFDKGANGSLEGQAVYYVNPNAGKTLKDVTHPAIKPDTGFTANGWNKEDTTEIKSDITVTAQYAPIADVIPKENPQGGENEKPDGYITVKFSTEKDGKIKDTDKTEKIVYVNPNKSVKLEGYAPEVTPNTGFTFADWDASIQREIKYQNNDVIKAKYNAIGDVIPQEKTDGSDKPEGYLTVTFDKGEHGTLSGKTVYYVKPNKEVTVPAPTVTPATGYVFKKWDQALTQTFTKDTTITAQYGAKPADPRPTTDYVVTELGVQPKPQDYEKAITPPAGKRIKDVQIVERPNVDKPGKTSATVKVIYEDGTTDQMTVPVFVQKKDAPTPELRPYPVPGDCNKTCDQPNQPNQPNKPNQPNVGKDALNTTDHYQYLIGYPDGNFGPNKGMTRAEAATMFTRLLNERPIKWRHYNAGLSDIRPGDWYANTVGYAVQRGIVSGYPDGSFKPNKPITRAEFAAIASRFDALAQGNAVAFSDLAPSHWGYNAIRSAATKGWISGYPDNTFRPEQAITRAEVTAITNRMLNRHADLYWIDAHPSEVIRFGDVKRSDWYFEPIMEATMGHDFIRDRDKKTEHWTGINGKSFI